MVQLKFDIIKLLAKNITKKFPDKYNFKNVHQKHNINDILTDIVYLLETGVSYAKLRSNISKSTINRHFIFLSKCGFFKETYKSLLDKYYLKNRNGKLKYQLIDSSFIANQYSSNKNISRNKYYKNKKGYKISQITDKNGIPISVLVDKGSINDTLFIKKHFENMLVNNSIDGNKYMLADKAYDTKNFRMECNKNDYINIIDFNKRNTKNVNKIKKLTPNEKKIYNNRIKIENSFSWIKKNRRLSFVYDKYISSFESFLYLALIKILLKRM